MLYSAATNSGRKAAYEEILFEYATARSTEQIDPNLQTGLGEPKVPITTVPTVFFQLLTFTSST